MRINIKDALFAFAIGIVATLALLTIVVAVCETIRPAQKLQNTIKYEEKR